MLKKSLHNPYLFAVIGCVLPMVAAVLYIGLSDIFLYSLALEDWQTLTIYLLLTLPFFYMAIGHLKQPISLKIVIAVILSLIWLMVMVMYVYLLASQF